MLLLSTCMGESIRMERVMLVPLSLTKLISVFVMYLCLITARRFMPDSSSLVIDVSCSLLLICDGILNRKYGVIFCFNNCNIPLYHRLGMFYFGFGI